MGLMKTRRRLAEDGSPYQAARPESAPYRVGAGVLPMWECCQFQCCQFPIWGGGMARGESV